ncbi:hypothetical protein K0504_10025 [Neiella marina]|uniref:Uncharacterized protein n=1 Tax=Neiella holothuriorum TaxID=2870530 RepID=A0ABS7EGP7_9GAMM|nr:TraE/TraK family type IV conjugative transfer system protein [Neiella holothuriorum]MBW8191375.1 hypothetical protein [Neiella holothuriorum]
MNIFKNLQVERSWSAAVASRNMAQVVNVTLGAAVLFLAFSLWLKDPHTVVTPPKFTQELTMVGDQASPSYKVGWAVFVGETVGNINPRNINFKRDLLIGMLSPNLQDSLGDQVERTVELMKTRKITQNFVMDDAHHDPRNDIVYVWGNKVTKAVRQDPIVTKWTYEIQIQSRQGQPRISYFKQYAGTPSGSELRGHATKNTPDYLSAPIQDAMDTNAERYIQQNEQNLPEHKPDVAPDKSADAEQPQK